MRVGLVNGWSDDNKGDAAIVHGFIVALRRCWPAAEVCVFSSLDATSFPSEHHYRFTGAPPYRASVVDGPFVTTYRPGAPRSGRWARVMELVAASVALGLGPLLHSRPVRALLGRRLRDSIAAMRHCDVIGIKGGHVLFASKGWRGLLGLYMNAIPLLLAARLGRPTALFGQSVGPFEGRASRWLAQKVLRRVKWVVVREPISLALAAELLGPLRERAVLAPDTAFLLTPQPITMPDGFPDRFIALTARQWHFPYIADRGKAAELQQRYYDAIRDLIVWAARSLGLRTILIPQVIGPTPAETDGVAWDEITRRTPPDCLPLRLEQDLRPDHLAGVYGRAELLVGTRFHSIILAALSGTPVVAIGYHGPKAEGILRSCGLEEFHVGIDSLEGAGLIALAERAMAQRPRFESAFRAVVCEAEATWERVCSNLGSA